MAYWYNVDRKRVEDDSNRSKGEQVLGPYETYDDASRALVHAQENTERWDEQDRRWREGDADQDSED